MSPYFVIRLDRLLQSLLVVLVFLGLVLFLASDTFRVKSLVCKTQYAACSSEIEASLASFAGEHIFLASEEEIKQTVLANFKVREVFVKKVLPSEILVLAEERKPMVGILPEGEEVVFLVDREGMVLQKLEATNLPKLGVEGKTLVVGEKIDGALSSAVVLLDLLARAGYKTDGQLDQELLLARLEGARVVLPLGEDPRVLVGSLQLILTRATIEGNKPRLIDLRFKNPVVEF